MKIRICKHCSQKYDIEERPKGWMANHVRWCKSNPQRDDSVKNKNLEKARASKTEEGRKRAAEKVSKLHKEGVYENSHKKSIETKRRRGNLEHTDETKKLMSDKRKDYLSKNKDKHPWKKSDKHISGPCENLKKYLDNNGIKYVSEWTPLEDRFYSIDIAFPDEKIGIEINGNQHYERDGCLKEYYQERHDLITSAGWTLYEIHYTQGYHPEEIMENIELGIQPDYTEYFEEIEKKKNKPKNTMTKGQKLKQNNIERNKHFIPLIENSNIDFSKMGWVKEVALILNISDQKIRGWMIRNMPIFYEEKCWKRKSPNK